MPSVNSQFPRMQGGCTEVDATRQEGPTHVYQKNVINAIYFVISYMHERKVNTSLAIGMAFPSVRILGAFSCDDANEAVPADAAKMDVRLGDDVHGNCAAGEFIRMDYVKLWRSLSCTVCAWIWDILAIGTG